MSFISTPNMNLPVPVVGQESGPQYATDVNSCFSLLDQHDHSPGKGVQITPNGLNINASLSMQNNLLINSAGVTFQNQTSTGPLSTMYEKGVDLFYVDGNGNDIRLTQSGSIAGSTGSISGLTPPASASYVSGLSTFVWQSNTNIAANMDLGAILMRNLSPNSTFSLTLQPPPGLASNFTLTLPVLPVASSFLTIDNSGTITASPLLSGGITTSMIGNLQITAAKIANNTITAGQVAPATLTTTELSASANIIPSQLNGGQATSQYATILNSVASYSNSTSSATTILDGDIISNGGLLVTTRPNFFTFTDGLNPGSGNPRIIVTGTATLILQRFTGATTVVTIQTYVMTAGTYPISILNTVDPIGSFAGSIRYRLQGSVAGGTLQVFNTSMTLVQV